MSYGASGLEGGVFNAIVRVASNAPTTPTDVTRVRCTSSARQNITATASDGLRLTYIGFPTTRTVVVTNSRHRQPLGQRRSSAAITAVTAGAGNFVLTPGRDRRT